LANPHQSKHVLGPGVYQAGGAAVPGP
jgi:hypothetical protein